MSERQARTSLGQIEERLRRALGLAGNIGASFEPKLTPVIIAGDATAPGNPQFRGRRFNASTDETPGVTWCTGVKALAPIVITRIVGQPATTPGASSPLTLRFYPPTTADPVTFNRNTQAPFLERGISITDCAPVSMPAINTANVAGGIIIYDLFTGIVNTPITIDVSIMLDTDAKILLGGFGAARWKLNFAGYVF